MRKSGWNHGGLFHTFSYLALILILSYLGFTSLGYFSGYKVGPFLEALHTYVHVAFTCDGAGRKCFYHIIRSKGACAHETEDCARRTESNRERSVTVMQASRRTLMDGMSVVGNECVISLD